MTFKNRFDAARKLAPKLEKYRGAPNTIILAIPRGALQMGYELAKLLNLPLDIVVTKKIPAPGNEEYAIGAIAPDGEVLLNKEEVRYYRIPPSYIETVKTQLMEAIRMRYETYRKGLPPSRVAGTPGSTLNVAPTSNVETARGAKTAPEIPSFAGKTVIVIDDGIATGFTMKAAIEYLKRQKVKKLVVAVPVAAADSAKEIKTMVDEFICLSTPLFFAAVGQFYEIFPQVSDEEAAEYLKKTAG